MQNSGSGVPGRTGALAVFDEQFLSTLADAVATRVVEKMSSKTGPQPRLMSVRKAAEYIGRSTQAVYNLAGTGKLPKKRQGQRILFDRFELDKWIDDLGE